MSTFEGAICDLKYFSGRANELHLLRDRVAELEGLLGMAEVPNWQIAALGFSRSEAAVLGVILKRKGCASREFIFTALYGSTMDCDQPEEKLVDIWISKVNSKLSRRFGFKIVNVRSHGWLLTEDSKEKLRDQLTTCQRPEGDR